jgi:hypothetical protein
MFGSADCLTASLGFAYLSISAVHFRNLHRLTRSRHRNSQNSKNPTCCILTPQYVSIRHRRYGLRHGASLCPRVAFHRNRIVLRM